MGWMGLGSGQGHVWCANSFAVYRVLTARHQGFAVFFSIFEVTRRSALFVKDYTKTMAATEPGLEQASDKHREKFVGHLPRTFHGITLVTGGASLILLYQSRKR